ncbi:MAG: amidophosphoribosyltransferase [Deltaproteobacteria bacterium]|nr:amidophosphoribosyltransferase [Deltaproteobacteria bacterium]
MFDKFKDECGIFGIYGHPEAANLTYLGLYALQHRGQEGAGIVSSDGSKLHSHKEMGLVADIFSEDVLKRLPGNNAIGHVRYSTAGESHLKNVQPIVVDYARGPLAVAHNGNLVNAAILRDELEAHGSIFQSTTDTEVIVHLIATSKEGALFERLVSALEQVRGAYSLLFLTETSMVAVRDPNGFRPLCLGRMKDSYVVASETCALDLVEAEYVRDIEPGEILVIDEKGLHSYKPFPEVKPSPCIFEFIYFARPDSNVFGSNVYEVRKGFGKQLAREHPVEADMVIPVPDSGVPAAIGYAEEAGLPFETGLIRNHYIGRTFIEPRQSIRHFGVKIKLNAVRGAFSGKRVVVVDDSIVRGTTARKIIKMIKAAGAKEIHFRISSPPTMFPCFYGVDTPSRQELIASTHTVEETNKYITSDTLGYLSTEGMLSVAKGDYFCDACFSGRYPVEFPWMGQGQLRLFEK